MHTMEVGAFTQAIIAAVHLLTYTGECAEAAYYPRGSERETTGYVSIDRCVLPTSYGMNADQILDLHAALNGDDQ